MATVELTEKNFEAHVEKPGILVIDWWAPWCGPCRTFGPIYDEASGKYPGVVFGKVNTEEQGGLAGTFGIQSIPTLMVFRDQILVFARPGMIPGHALDELIDKVQGLNMDDVRAQIAEDEANHKHDHDGHGHEGHDHEGHDHEGHNHEGHNHEGHSHGGHDHSHDDGHDHDHKH